MLVYPIKWYRKPRRGSPARSARDNFIAIPNVGQIDHIQDDRTRHGGVEYGVQGAATRPIAPNATAIRDRSSTTGVCSACGNGWITSTQVPA